MIYIYPPQSFNYYRFIRNTSICTSTILIKRSIIKGAKFTNTKIQLENIAIGYSTKDVELNYLRESSSSTLRDLNINSQYFKSYVLKNKSKKIYLKNRQNHTIQKIVHKNLEIAGGISYDQEEKEYAESIYKTFFEPDNELGTQENIRPFRYYKKR